MSLIRLRSRRSRPSPCPGSSFRFSRFRLTQTIPVRFRSTRPRPGVRANCRVIRPPSTSLRSISTHRRTAPHSSAENEKERVMAITRALLEDLSDHWWVILLRGIVGVIFAVLAFAWPGATLLGLVLVWGAYAIVDGVFALYLTSLAARQQRRWWPYLLEGLVGIGAGV